MGRYGVVHYPTYFVVIDKAIDTHPIVFESRSRHRAHAACNELNAKLEATKPGDCRVCGGDGFLSTPHPDPRRTASPADPTCPYCKGTGKEGGP